jgi:hypothetical protein
MQMHMFVNSKFQEAKNGLGNDEHSNFCFDWFEEFYLKLLKKVFFDCLFHAHSMLPAAVQSNRTSSQMVRYIQCTVIEVAGCLYNMQ